MQIATCGKSHAKHTLLSGDTKGNHSGKRHGFEIFSDTSLTVSI